MKKHNKQDVIDILKGVIYQLEHAESSPGRSPDENEPLGYPKTYAIHLDEYLYSALLAGMKAEAAKLESNRNYRSAWKSWKEPALTWQDAIGTIKAAYDYGVEPMDFDDVLYILSEKHGIKDDRTIINALTLNGQLPLEVVIKMLDSTSHSG